MRNSQSGLFRLSRQNSIDQRLPQLGRNIQIPQTVVGTPGAAKLPFQGKQLFCGVRQISRSGNGPFEATISCHIAIKVADHG